jgi:ABC-2 type transport system permease protein
MAIFLKAYQGYSGTVSPPFERTLVIFRYALEDVFESRLFIAFFIVSLLLPVGLMCFLYVYYNVDLLIQFEVPLGDLPPIDGSFFAVAMQIPQNFLLLLLVLAIGPTMISPDLRNNAMPLYLSRPISISSYILGKLLVILFLGSLISWVPGILLIFLQAFLAGEGWLLDNLHIPMAAAIASLVWIFCLSLLAFAISAFVKWKAVARIFFFGLILLGSVLGEIIEEIFGGVGGYIVNLYAAQEVLMTDLYQADADVLGFLPDMPIEIALMQFAVVTAIAVFLLARRIREFQGVV